MKFDLIYVKIASINLDFDPSLPFSGYLVKCKSNVLQNRTRFFRLTEKKLSYAEENGGKVISSVMRYVGQ